VSPLTLVPFSQDPLSVAAQQILEHYKVRLPDLSDCRILVAEDQCAAQLRTELLKQAEQRGFSALLGPSIERLDQCLSQLAAVSGAVLNRPAQELVLAEALRNAAQIYADTDPWLLADQLLTLFDELTRRDISIPAAFEQFQASLQRSYALSSPSPSLQQEASILHTLWHAWKQQLEAENLSDPAAAYRQQLADSLNCIGKQKLWLIGFTEFTPSEAQWLRILIDRQQAQLILHGGAQQDGYHPDRPIGDILDQLELDDTQQSCLEGNDFDDFISALFETSTDDLKQRAIRFAGLNQQDTAGSRLRTFQADSPEQEAQAVALQVRRWLLDGIQPIAIVTEDRRLARRLRAMLEASQIELDDAGGWALSTTSAAATLERWLETVEEDFACGPLLDVLKSPFVCFSDRDTHLAQVRRLEQDIILHENIARGLQRYRHHLDRRSERLPGWSQPMRHAVQQMLNVLDHAASPLKPLLHGSYPASDFLGENPRRTFAEIMHPDDIAPISVAARHRELLIHSCDVGRSPGDLQRDFPTLCFKHLPDRWWHQGPENDDGIAVEPLDVFLQRIAAFERNLTQIKERPLAIVGHGNAFKALTGQMMDNCEVLRYQPGKS